MFVGMHMQSFFSWGTVPSRSKPRASCNRIFGKKCIWNLPPLRSSMAKIDIHPGKLTWDGKMVVWGLVKNWIFFQNSPCIKHYFAHFFRTPQGPYPNPTSPPWVSPLELRKFNSWRPNAENSAPNWKLQSFNVRGFYVSSKRCKRLRNRQQLGGSKFGRKNLECSKVVLDDFLMIHDGLRWFLMFF